MAAATTVMDRLQLGASDAVGVAACSMVAKGGVPAGLHAAGFSAVGVVKGSIAAHWMAALGGHIASGSLFAFCQSMAAGGAALGTGPVLLSGVLLWLLARYPSGKLMAAAVAAHPDAQLHLLPAPLQKLWRQAIEMVRMGRSQDGHT